MVPELEIDDYSNSGDMENNNNKNDDDDGGKSPSTSLWKQLLAVSPVYVLQLCFGMSSGYPAITTPQLTANCTGNLTISKDQESWIVAIDSVVSPVTSILSGYLQQDFGPRQILILTCVPYLAGWVSAALAGQFNNLYLLYVSRLVIISKDLTLSMTSKYSFFRICVGAAYGFLATTIYTVEVVSKELRGSLLVFAGK